MKQSLISAILALLISYSTSAQVTAASPDIKSPNIASLGVFGDFPVSPFTGTPDISIPLTTLKGKDLNLPLLLRYNPNSVKPDQRGGWVGLGWNLSVGSIYRETKGYPDEMDCESIPTTGYYYRRNLINTDWYLMGEAPNLVSIDRIIWHRALAYYTDLEADIFHFNVMGLQGTFFLDQDGNWQVQSDQFVSVELDPVMPFIEPLTKSAFSSSNLVSKSFNKFILKDGYGNKYIFGSADATEYTSIINVGLRYFTGGYQEASGVTLQASAWHILEIQSANGVDKIEFSYERGPYVTSLYKYAFYNNTYKNSNCSNFISLGWHTGGSLISPVYLKEIKTGYQKISFNFSKSDELNFTENDYLNMQGIYPSDYLGPMGDVIENSSHNIPYYINHDLSYSPYYSKIIWVKLDSINYDVNNKRLSSINFTYNNLSNERLFLQTVSFTGNKSTEVYKYSFNYNNKNQLPAYLQTVTDHWGFYNGIAFGTFNPENVFVQRQPNASFILKGVLSSITFPTGGKTDFEFELGDYSKIVNKGNRKYLQNESGTGGIRIHKLKSFDEDNNMAFTKEYVYKSNSIAGGTTSSGVLNNKPLYYIGTTSGTDMSGGSFTFSSFKSSSVHSLSDQSGISIGYSEVLEITGEGGSSYYKVEEFSNHDNNFTDDNAVYGYKSDLLVAPAYNDRSFERGRVLRTVYYDNMRKKIKSVTNSYDAGSVGVNSSRSLMYNYLDVATDCNAEYYYPSSVAYLKYSGPIFLAATVDSSFTDYGISSDKKTFQYDNNYKVITRKTEITSTGKEKVYNYAYAYKYASNSNYSSVYDTMKNESLLLFPVEESVRRDGLFTSAKVNDYATFGGIIKNSDTYILHSTVPLTSYSQAYLSAGSLKVLIKDVHMEKLYEVINYDDRANPLEIVSQSGPTTAYLWGYHGQYPVVKIVNAGNNNRQTTYNYQYGYRTVSKYYNLNIYSGQEQFSFTTGQTGDVKIALPGYLNEDWAATYSFMQNNYSGGLLSMRSMTSQRPYPEVSPWSEYSSNPYYKLNNTHSGVPAGTYILSIYPESRFATNGSSSDQLCITYTEKYIAHIDTVITGENTWFYEGFENNASDPENAFAGKGFHNGAFVLEDLHLSAERQYLVNYHYFEDVWKNKTVPYSVNMTLSDGTAIDEIRVFPVDARMTTYTYDPPIGMTSMTDENNRTTFYEYDGLGRLRLIKDDNGNIIKRVCYNYAGQPEDCND